MSQFDSSIFYLLDSIPPRAIKNWIKLHEGIVDYSSEHFSFFSHRRSQVFDQLQDALGHNTKPSLQFLILPKNFGYFAPA